MRVGAESIFYCFFNFCSLGLLYLSVGEPLLFQIFIPWKFISIYLNHFYIYLFVSVVSSIIQQWSTEKTENGRYGMFQMVYIKVNELHVVHP